MDLIGHFDSMNLRSGGPNNRRRRREETETPRSSVERDRSPLRPSTPSLPRFFSPNRPPSPRPVQPRGASNRLESTPKRHRGMAAHPKFSGRLPVGRNRIARRLFDSSSSGSTLADEMLMDAMDGLLPPQMASSPLRTNNPLNDSAIDLSASSSSSSVFLFSSTRNSSVQTDEDAANNSSNNRYFVEVNPANLLTNTSPSTSQRLQQESQQPASRQPCHHHCLPASSTLYKSRLRRTSRSWMLPASPTSADRTDAAVQADAPIIEVEDEEAPAPPTPSNQNQSLLQALECPVCYGHCLPPVTQCRWGHVICNACLPQCLPACPVCRTSGPGAFVRSIALDTIANELAFPCRFADAGCSIQNLTPAAKMAHEYACPFKFSRS